MDFNFTEIKSHRMRNSAYSGSAQELVPLSIPSMESVLSRSVTDLKEEMQSQMLQQKGFVSLSINCGTHDFYWADLPNCHQYFEDRRTKSTDKSNSHLFGGNREVGGVCS